MLLIPLPFPPWHAACTSVASLHSAGIWSRMRQLSVLTIPAVAAVALLSAVDDASAIPITCNVLNASANGSYADACAGDDAIAANPGAETTFVNTSFAGDDFLFVDRTGDASSVAGFVLNVSSDPTPDAPDLYRFLYTLTVPNEYVGTVVDWALVIKQASDSTIAYLFNDVTLGIDGGYNSFWLNPAGKWTNDFSHASGLIRVSPVQVPEPGTLPLMLVGLILAVAGTLRRRRA
jgi:hypothetical protein